MKNDENRDKSHNIFSIDELDFLSNDKTTEGNIITDANLNKEEFTKWFAKVISEIKGIHVDEIQLDKTFSFYGFTSVEGMRLSGEIQEYINGDLPPAIIYEYPVIKDLINYICMSVEAESDQDEIKSKIYRVDQALLESEKSEDPSEDVVEMVVKYGLIMWHEELKVCVKYAQCRMSQELDYFLSSNSHRIYRLLRENWNKIMPLSHSQQRYLVASMMQTGKAAYNNPVAYTIDGEIDFEKLVNAINCTVQQNSIMRSDFKIMGEFFYQTIRSSAMIQDVPYVNLVTDDAAELKLKSLMAEESVCTINPLQDEKIRFTYVHLGDRRNMLLVTVHHTLFDGFSFEPFINQISKNYFMENTSITQSDNYEDYILSEYCLQPDEDELYWQGQLTGAPSHTQLPLDRSRPEVNSYSGRTIEYKIPGEVLEIIKNASKELEITLFSNLLTYLYVLIYLWSRCEDIVFGTVVQNRDKRAYRETLGDFTNLLPLRMRIDDSLGIASFAKEVNHLVQSALMHKRFPYNKMIELNLVGQEYNINPLYNIHVNYLPYDSNIKNIPLDIQVQNNRKLSKSSMMDLRFEFVETGNDTYLSCEYNSDLFYEATIVGLLKQYIILVKETEYQKALSKIKLPNMSYIKHQTVPKQTVSELNVNNTVPENLDIVMEAYKVVTKKQSIDVNGNFFEIGGSSVKAVQLVNYLESKNIRINVTDIFKYPSVKLLASYLAQMGQVSSQNENAEEIESLKLPVKNPTKSSSSKVNRYTRPDSLHEGYYRLYVLRKCGGKY